MVDGSAAIARSIHPPLVKIYFDGGCRPNPGEMQVAVVARGVVHHAANLGRGSSEQAEWLALLHGISVARTLGERDIVLLGDAVGVIAQANGTAKCRNTACLEQFRQQAAIFERVRVRFIRRNQNLAGIALGKIGERQSSPLPSGNEVIGFSAL